MSWYDCNASVSFRETWHPLCSSIITFIFSKFRINSQPSAKSITLLGSTYEAKCTHSKMNFIFKSHHIIAASSIHMGPGIWKPTKTIWWLSSNTSFFFSFFFLIEDKSKRKKNQPKPTSNANLVESGNWQNGTSPKRVELFPDPVEEVHFGLAPLTVDRPVKRCKHSKLTCAPMYPPPPPPQ